MAFDGTNYLVVWSDGRTAGNYVPDIYGTRVSKAGVLLSSAGILISAAKYAQSEPAVAFDGTNYLVVWADDRVTGNFTDDIYGARVTKAGAVLDANGFPISAAPNVQLEPAVAFDGTDYLVVWADGRSNVSLHLYGSRVSKPGSVLDASGIAISNPSGAQDEPRVTANGSSFCVVWRDYRSGHGPDIYGTRMDDTGSVLDDAGIAIATSATGESEPGVVAGPAGTVGVVYSRFAPEAPYGSHRVFLRTSPK